MAKQKQGEEKGPGPTAAAPAEPFPPPTPESPPPVPPGPPGQPQPSGGLPEAGEVGLFLRGTIETRWKRRLASGVEVVSYRIAGIVVQQFRPDGYFSIGQWVCLPVEVKVYEAKAGPRYSLQIPSPPEGVF